MIFKLDDFFYSSKRKYVYADYILNINNIDKEQFLKKLGIAYSSFRTEKSRNNVHNDNIDRILDTLGINKIDVLKKVELELLLKNFYYAIYYKEKDKINSYIEIINNYIKENNILKPVFIMFKIWGNISLDYPKEKIDELIDEDLKFISYFKKGYFDGSLKLIYYSLLYAFNYDIRFEEVSSLAVDNDLKWMYLVSVGSRFYFERRDNEALNYYFEALMEFKLHNNSERYMSVLANIAFSHNILKNYTMSLKIISESLEYIHSSKNSKWIKNILMHYLYSNYMLSRYNEIINFYKNEIHNFKRLNWVSAAILILSAYKISRISEISSLIEEFKDDDNISLLLKYIKDNNIEHIKKIKNVTYMENIINTFIPN